MDNLQLKDCRVIDEDIPDTEQLQAIHLNDNICCFFASSEELFVRDLFGTSMLVTFPEELHGPVVSLSFLSTWNAVFIATDSNLIVCDLTNVEFSSMKYPNSDAKIIQASWNLNQTFLVVVDNLGALSGYIIKSNPDLSGDYEFIPVHDGHLEGDVANSVYVGWGAHETQFKGIKKQKEIVKEIPQDYSRPVISWRGNGEMFVINYWKHNRRFLKVFNADLRALYVSEPYNNLLSPTSFKGQGNFIACASTDGETNRVVVFEKNCLVKSSFLVPENKGEIKGVQYHPEKHLLAVHSQSSTESCLNIYLYANGTWYLKQQFCYLLSEPKRLLKFHWVGGLNAHIYRLNVLTSTGYHLYDFTAEPYGVFHDLVAVIDGPKVLFTEFSQKIVPPPMASKTLHFDKPVNSINFYSDSSVYGFCLSNGHLVYYKYCNDDFVEYDGASLKDIKASYNSMSSFKKIIDKVSHHIVLNNEHDLVIDEKVVSSNVSSVHVHEDYLLFTQVGNDSYKLYCVRLTEAIISSWSTDIFYSREIEPGAKIVCVTKKNYVVLILPRGNLETITCRLMSIDAVEHHLSQNNWCAAINQIRNERLNWNLLIDLNKQRFANHIQDFIEAAGAVSVLNTIVSEFGTENCLETVYEAWSRQESPMQQYSLGKSSKISVLNSILLTLVQLNPIVNLLSIVTLQVKHYSIRAALKSILQAFELDHLDICKEAVGQILLYEHAQDIICAAYTLYNLQFLSFIYSSCSEDPKFFAPEIEALQTLSNIDLRFTMNVKGKDFKMATKYLVRMESKNENFIRDFIKKHEMQSVAYNSVRPGDLYFKTITVIYADYLAFKSRHNEAGLILERAGLYEEALAWYKIARNWQKVVAILNVLKLQDDIKIQALRTLAQDLVNHRLIEEGAFIYEHHCGDHKAAIKTFVDHKMFQKALGLAKQYGSIELIENVIQPALKKFREDLQDRISELKVRFGNYTSRLLLLREKKYEKLLRHQLSDFEDGGDAELEVDSTNSEYGSLISKSSMGSTHSRGSRSSSMSGRSQRKLEKKKTDIREGGTFEDIALIRQLYLLTVDISAAGQDVAEVCYSLIDEENFKFAKMLQSKLEDIQLQVKEDIPLIWSETFLNAEFSSKPDVVAVIENRHELDEQYRSAPSLKKLDETRDKLQIFI